MGYTTDFEGEVQISPPLNQAEIEYLNRFARTRRMDRKNGPYYANPGSDGFGQDNEPDIVSYNDPPAGQPSLWCQWVPTEDGAAIEWDGGEKFYHSEKWMAYIIDHFLKPGAHASKSGDPQFKDFTFNHKVSGTIHAYGEDRDDIWRLVVTDNAVKVERGAIAFA